MDFSTNFVSKRIALIEETGGKYREFLQTLTPHYHKVWRDIVFGYLMLALSLYIAWLLQPGAWFLIGVPLGGLLIGYWVAYIQLFIHEAAHYNLWHDKNASDRLGDLFIAWQVGTTIRDYRATHFPHHTKIGTAEDTEASYFNALTPRFILETLTGIHALRVFLARRKSGAARGANRSWGPLLRGVAVHLALLGFLFYMGAWAPALAWMGGVGVVFPFFATMRQLLEHREPAAFDANGPTEGVTRIFGDGPVASTFGGAGFNRHLLHHWEPTLSYTRLKDYETYLLTTSVAPLLRERSMTYATAFLHILKADNKKVPHG
ncbi:MAG: fatty acid desaturase [Phycisphaeraceae bacterium]|nr:fatty acid desaturase [Phycisphaeraceae bacterium]